MTKYQDRLLRQHIAYKQCFMGDDGELTPAAKIVMNDLSRFCGALATPTVISSVSQQTDVPATMQRVGRAEVFFRLWRFLKLPTQSIFEVHQHNDDN